MAYKVIKYFTDMQDNDFEYNEGDIFPREDFKILPSRIKELSTTQNRRKEILIVEVPDEDKHKKEKKTKSEKTDEE
jgi:hypothetical protein